MNFNREIGEESYFNNQKGLLNQSISSYRERNSNVFREEQLNGEIGV